VPRQDWSSCSWPCASTTAAINIRPLCFPLSESRPLLLLAVFLLDRSHNTHRWIRLGAFSLQPSELAKPALILFLAFFLESRFRSVGSTSMDDARNTLLPAAVPRCVFLILIVLQPDLGTAIACAGIAASIFYVAGVRLRYFGYSLLVATLPLYYLLFHVGWRRERMLAFLNPFADPQGRGFHMIQSLIAVSTGWFIGRRFDGREAEAVLSARAAHGISSLAVISEELGLIGGDCRGCAVCGVSPRPGRCARRSRLKTRSAVCWPRALPAWSACKRSSTSALCWACCPPREFPLPLCPMEARRFFVMLLCVGVLLNVSKQIE